jgi:hypothetical protein
LFEDLKELKDEPISNRSFTSIVSGSELPVDSELESTADVSSPDQEVGPFAVAADPRLTPKNTARAELLIKIFLITALPPGHCPVRER